MNVSQTTAIGFGGSATEAPDTAMRSVARHELRRVDGGLAPIFGVVARWAIKRAIIAAITYAKTH